jgi:DsbC/DsbD-like thiol-disulfide interchange protein
MLNALADRAAAIRISALSATCVLSALAAGPTLAADASAWQGDQNSSVRLISGAPAREAAAEVLRTGIEIRLQPGWKTYWRYPGDSGVPPRFDFAQSDNVAQASVLWPAPQRFADGGGGNSIGYAGSIILPVRIVPRDAAKPVTIRLSLDYAICEKLCIPAEAKVALAPARARTSFDPPLSAAEARVPKPAVLGRAGPLAIRSMLRDPQKPGRILVDVAAAPGSPVDLFVEGPTADWALPLPERVDGAPAGLQRFAFELDGLPAGAKPDGAVLKLTATTASDAVEVAAPLH